MSFDLTELDRRLSNLIRIGKVDQVDYGISPPKARIWIGDASKQLGILTDWLPWFGLSAGEDRSCDPLDIGEQVMIFSPCGELNQGVVLAGIFQAAHPYPVTSPDKRNTTYKDGAVIEYDRQAHHLKAVLPAGATAELIADGGIAITGDITLTGKLTASVDVIADGISLKNHKTSLVQPGSGQSGMPV
ncbi:phage baseplate assembly protein V [Methylobacter tundripaludum]|uniref:Phage baseplate assembly protein V n=1 Tax=Methylobacter tundripaludum (strain ATCC BAA-1195 / DSM 17260 / SV96) TaxID=697282 RepID=G3IRF1_METTV|nr:phage baseplate assembly protein V [Methylobacter tundripaludum]EGW22162.1 phage baseplate assembly protein V [Methylobacter tundripaludum SV96]